MNVFFINNNTSLFCSILSIDHLGLDWSQSVVALSRKTDGSWLPFAKTYDLDTSKGFERFQGLLKDRSQAFNVFLPHDGASRGIRRQAINHSGCQQVYYLEEGMLSHEAYPYRLSTDARKVCRLPIIGKALVKKLQKPLFSAENAKFLALSEYAFPFANRDTVIPLSDYQGMLQYYSPRINRQAFIMLATPAEAFEPILGAYKELANQSEPKPVYLKLHPDAYKHRYERRTAEIIRSASDVGAGVLDPGTIIEAEVLLNGHHLIGNQTTSLAMYSRMLGGGYTAVDPWASADGIASQQAPGSTGDRLG
ncbi:hypothetical protein V6X63_04905 [Spiribacter sp. 221]|uniref:hypothetical protein n=1 Tax=Spiribacter onubensis TaxID=3122420 RepID=UPI00349FBD66